MAGARRQWPPAEAPVRRTVARQGMDGSGPGAGMRAAVTTAAPRMPPAGDQRLPMNQRCPECLRQVAAPGLLATQSGGGCHVLPATRAAGSNQSSRGRSLYRNRDERRCPRWRQVRHESDRRQGCVRRSPHADSRRAVARILAGRRGIWEGTPRRAETKSVAVDYARGTAAASVVGTVRRCTGLPARSSGERGPGRGEPWATEGRIAELGTKSASTPY